MSDCDQLTDSAELHRLRSSLSAVSVPKPPPVEVIIARGRARRLHRRYRVAGLFLATAGIAAALVVGPLGAAPAAGPTAAPVAGRSLGAIRTAAYSIVPNSDGTASLTIDPNEIFDPEELENDLAQYGIPSKVTVGRFCTSDPAPAGLSQVVSYQPREATITIDPTTMPAGTELSFGGFELRMNVELATYTLIDKDSYNCSDTPPTSSSDRSGLHSIGGWMRRR